MRPTDSLREDHQVILRMCKVLNSLANKIEDGENIAAETLKDATVFIKNFADKCHHGKEEELLYPRAGDRGVPIEGGPIAVMLIEHDQGRECTRNMAAAAEACAAGDEEARLAFAGNARSYAELLVPHIDKEDNILYPMCDEVLTEADQVDLETKFDEVEKERMGEEKHHEYINLVEVLESEYVAV
ncbi:MAG: hemerythrin domain-containing protein [Actinomycetota bacterium]